jgi:isopropylmalate/homocitrate/citramalate synthase
LRRADTARKLNENAKPKTAPPNPKRRIKTIFNHFSNILARIEYALRKGLKIRCSLEDATRSDVDFAVRFALEAMKLGERYGRKVSFKLADTLGLGLPLSEAEPPRGIPRLVRAFIEAGISGESLEFHGHNDLGLAVANHLAAWSFGASMSNCILLGIGERAGNCPLEVIAVT